MKLSNTTKLFNLITFYIILITFIGLSGSFLSDYLIEINWFNDIDTGKTFIYDGGKVIDWGIRHYWYNWGVFFLFVSTIIRAIVSCITYYNKLEKESRDEII